MDDLVEQAGTALTLRFPGATRRIVTAGEIRQVVANEGRHGRVQLGRPNPGEPMGLFID